MTTAIPLTNVGSGYTVVTHVLPPQPPQSGTQQEQNVSLFGPFGKFLKGEPKALGVIQIMIGLFTLLIGFVKTIEPDLIYSGIVYWSSIFYIVSGSLAVAASKKPNRCVVNGSLVMNIFSTITAGIAIIFCSLRLALRPPYRLCYYSDYSDRCDLYHSIIHGITGVLLVFFILEFCISIRISAFACKASCTNDPSVSVTVVPNPAGSSAVNPFPANTNQQVMYVTHSAPSAPKAPMFNPTLEDWIDQSTAP